MHFAFILAGLAAFAAAAPVAKPDEASYTPYTTYGTYGYIGYVPYDQATEQEAAKMRNNAMHKRRVTMRRADNAAYDPYSSYAPYTTYFPSYPSYNPYNPGVDAEAAKMQTKKRGIAARQDVYDGYDPYTSYDPYDQSVDAEAAKMQHERRHFMMTDKIMTDKMGENVKRDMNHPDADDNGHGTYQ